MFLVLYIIVIIFFILKDMEVYEEKLRKALIQYLQLRIQHDSSFKVCVLFCFVLIEQNSK